MSLTDDRPTSSPPRRVRRALVNVGWVGLDPTNDKLVDWQYVRVAIGRDYGDVQPVRGMFRGEGEQSLSVFVDVTLLQGGA